jgi:hypothetical protein
MQPFKKKLTISPEGEIDTVKMQINAEPKDTSSD